MADTTVAEWEQLLARESSQFNGMSKFPASVPALETVREDPVHEENSEDTEGSVVAEMGEDAHAGHSAEGAIAVEEPAKPLSSRSEACTAADGPTTAVSHPARFDDSKWDDSVLATDDADEARLPTLPGTHHGLGMPGNPPGKPAGEPQPAACGTIGDPADSLPGQKRIWYDPDGTPYDPDVPYVPQVYEEEEAAPVDESEAERMARLALQEQREALKMFWAEQQAAASPAKG